MKLRKTDVKFEDIDFELPSFDFKNAIIIKVEDSKINFPFIKKFRRCIKQIYVEWNHRGEIPEFDEDGTLELDTGGSAIIEFTNGKKLLILNSEWCSLNWLD